LLSWDDFCGYEEIRITLKRLLKLSTIHRRDNVSVEGGISIIDSIASDSPSVRTSSVHTSSARTSSVRTEASKVMTITGTSQNTKKASTLLNDIKSSQKNECTMTLRESLKVSSDKVRGIVLYGPSGCGKSFLARIIAAEVMIMINLM
jgi:DNA replication protein DnaC